MVGIVYTDYQALHLEIEIWRQHFLRAVVLHINISWLWLLLVIPTL